MTHVRRRAEASPTDFKSSTLAIQHTYVKYILMLTYGKISTGKLTKKKNSRVSHKLKVWIPFPDRDPKLERVILGYVVTRSALGTAVCKTSITPCWLLCSTQSIDMQNARQLTHFLKLPIKKKSNLSGTNSQLSID